jgi:3-oxoacyl-[acyl-carrier protein] reductase
MMPLSLLGKTALVCGSTQGIGRAAAIELAHLGANVVLFSRSEDSLKRVLSELPAAHGMEHTYLAADFSSPYHVGEKVREYLAGGKTIHILVNNTGGPPPGPVSEAKVEEFNAAFAQHLICNHILAQAVIPGMKEAGYGRIINVISTSVKAPIPNLGVSNTIRAAVANWSKTLSLEVARYGITVNNVLPGATSTGRLDSIINNKAGKTQTSKEKIEEELMREIPAGRFGAPEELAYVIAFLASPAASYINGINLPVDGGRTGNL